MTPLPLFSVVIPTRNRRRLVIEAVESVLAQDRDDHEIVVVDDGSTDGTRDDLAAYGERIVVRHQEHQGVAAARNRGIRESRGAIVGFLDSDDRWEPHTLSRVAGVFEARPGAGYVSIMAREMDADGQPTERTYGKKSSGERYTTASLLGPDCGGCSWFFVRRPVLERVGGYDESLRSAEEIDLCLRLSFVTEMIALREPLLLRRKHAGNLSRDMELNARMWLHLLGKLERQHPEFVETHPREFQRTLAKERLRLGRELLARAPGDPSALSESRRLLSESLRGAPGRRALTYLAWSWLAPATYARFRRRERARSEPDS